MKKLLQLDSILFLILQDKMACCTPRINSSNIKERTLIVAVKIAKGPPRFGYTVHLSLTNAIPLMRSPHYLKSPAMPKNGRASFINTKETRGSYI